MRKLQSIVIVLGQFAITGTTYADAYSDTIKTFKSSNTVQVFFKQAYGYAVFPTVGKAGFGIGAAHGDGRVYKKGVVSGSASMTKISIGLQAGGQAYSQIIFFEDERAYREFTSGNFEFGAHATAVVITSGAQAQAGSEGTSASADKNQVTAGYNKGMIVFAHIKGGLMYEASIGGQKYKFKPLSGQ